MVLNSPIFLVIIAVLCILGLAVVVQIFRKGLSGFERIAFVPGALRQDSTKQSLASTQFRSLLLQTIAIPIVTCSILVVTFLYQSNSVLKLSQWVQHTDEVLLQANKVHRSILETESNLRGFLLTNEKQFSDQYEKSRLEAPALQAELAAMAADNPVQFEAAKNIQKAFSDWTISSERAQQLRLKNQISMSSDIVERRKIMNDLKDHLENFEALEAKLKEERFQAVKAGANTSLLIVVALSIGAGLFLALSGGHQLRKLSGNYSGLVTNLDEANRDLEVKVDERTLELTATNKELEAFCYSVSHDLRAPLRGIDGFSQILIEEYQSKIDADGIKYLNYIRQGVQKMGVLIDDLLNLSRLTRIEINFKEFEISQMAQEIMTALQASDPSRKINFKNIEKSIVTADPGLIRVALENLLSNALKYSAKKESSDIEFGVKTTEHGPTYFVRDNGVGFDMKYYGKLFHVFQRLHDNAVYKGTGIGLATVKRVIARHGGEIWAESIPDKETNFYFTLKRKA